MDEFDLAQLLLDLQEIDRWTLTGPSSAKTRLGDTELECFFYPDGAVKLHVNTARFMLGPKTARFTAADFSGPVARSIVGSRFYQWLKTAAQGEKSRAFGPSVDTPHEVWTRPGAPSAAAYDEKD